MLVAEELLRIFSEDKPRRTPVIPFVMQFGAKQAGIDYRDYCTDSGAMAESQISCLERFDYDAANVSSDAHRLAEALGGDLYFPRDGVPVVKDPPIKSEKDLDNLEIPDPVDVPRCRQRIDAIKVIKDYNTDITVIGWVEGALSDASSIFGPRNALKAFYKAPDMLGRLFRFAVEFNREFAQVQVEAGADIIGAGDSLASQISRENFEWSVTHTEKIFASVDVPTLYHVCGDTTHQLQVLEESGADVIDLDREVDLSLAREVLGPDRVIRGNVDPVLFVSSNQERIEKLSRKCIEEAGTKDSFILSAGCEIPPDSDPQNLETMIEVAKKYHRKRE